jgi:hypothetical protein
MVSRPMVDQKKQLPLNQSFRNLKLTNFFLTFWATP